MRDIKQISDTDRLTSSLFFISTILYTTFIMIVSLTPLNKKPSGFLEIQSIQDILTLNYFPDMVINVLFYIPLGILLALAVSANKPSIITPWLAVGSILSFGMESIQFFIGRFSTVTDIITNSLGFIMGFAIVLIGIKLYGLNPAKLVGFDDNHAIDNKIKVIVALRFLYICVFFIIAIYPFDVSVQISAIYKRLLPDNMGNPHIILDPFFHLHNWSESVPMLAFYLSTLLPIAILSSLLDSFEKRLYILSPVYSCLILAIYSEGAQIFVVSRTSDIIMLPIAFVTGIIGWCIVKIWFRFRKVITRDIDQPANRNKQVIVIAFIVYVIFLCLISWSPYQFEKGFGLFATKVFRHSNLVPFEVSFSTHNITDILNIIKKISLYIPMGFLIAFSIKSYYNSRVGIAVMAGLLYIAFAVFLELSQASCIGKYVDSTNIILSLLGGIIGAFCIGLLKYANPLFKKYQKQD